MRHTKWYKSKTIWANVISVVAMVAQNALGFEVTAEEATAVLVLVNLACRAVTDGPLEP